MLGQLLGQMLGLLLGNAWSIIVLYSRDLGMNSHSFMVRLFFPTKVVMIQFSVSMMHKVHENFLSTYPSYGLTSC